MESTPKETLVPDIVANDPFWLPIIGVVSAAIFAVICLLMWGPRPEGVQGIMDVSYLPFFNASVNALVTVVLVCGWRFAVTGRLRAHRKAMLTAFGLSTAFLVSYVVYHSVQVEPVVYEGAYRGLYLAILLSHIVLAAIILPLALLTLYLGQSDQRARHRKLAKVTLPIWLYVSITGVVIVLLVYV